MNLKKFLKLFIILLLSILILSFVGCNFSEWKYSKYILELPSHSTTSKIVVRDVFKTFDEMLEATKDPNTIVIVCPAGLIGESVKDIAAAFEAETGIKTAIFDGDIEFINEVTVLDINTGYEQEGCLDVVISPYISIGEFFNDYEVLNEMVEDSDIEIEDFFPDIFNLTSTWKKDGSILGIPIKYSVSSIMYKSDILSDLNIPTDKTWTYDEYYQYLEMIQNSKSVDNTVLFDSSELSTYWLNRYWSEGGHTMTELWEVTIDNETGYKAYEMLQSLFKYAPDGIADKTYDEIVSEFISGSTAIFEGYPDFSLSSGIDSNIGFLPTPEGLQGNSSLIDAWIASIRATSDKQDKAWEWIKYYTSKENSKALLSNYGILPSRISAYEDAELNNQYSYLKNIYDLLKNTEIRIFPKIRVGPIVETLLNEEIKNKIIEGKSSPQDVIKDIQSEWETQIGYATPDRFAINEEY